MKFCIKCDNMYYIGINEQNPNELTHYCRNCGYIDNSNIKENYMCSMCETTWKTNEKK